ncbi:ABC transporter permease [Plantactinospora sp. B5E13]|uniref:ABC transporter permease n=1 Tax=unclassified Plantactinospora TaxID=2631981 RepID=UPI00325D8F22
MTDRPALSPGARIGLPIVGVLTTIGLWWLTTILLDIEPLFLPAPPDVLDAFASNAGYLAEETWSTLWATLTGFGLAALGGLLAGMLLTSSRVLEQATLPMIVAFNAVPKVSLIPLLVLWMGYGAKPRITLVVLVAFFPVMVSTMAGLTSTPTELIELTRSLDASRLRTYRTVRLPWALPQVFVGLKVAMTLALIGAVVAEIQSPNAGLGAIILTTQQSADTPLAFAAIGLLAILGVSLFYLVVAAERLAVPWARQVTA